MRAPPPQVELVRADDELLPFVMVCERRPGYEALVGRWDQWRHQAALRDERHAYFVAMHAGTRAGFAILRDWASPEKVTLLKRIAVLEPGRGMRRALLGDVVERVFQETEAWRLWLGVFPENEAARRAYEAEGFKTEGVARGSAYFGGVHRDELVMALLRPEWARGVHLTNGE